MNVLIADNNDLIRVGLQTVLASTVGIQVVAEASSNEELLERVKAFDIDVILIDYTSPKFSIDIIPRLLGEKKNLRFVAITPDQSAQTVVHALRSGVMSHIKKDCDITEIINSVQETGIGNQFFCGQILETIQKANIDVEDINLEKFSCEPVILSERELEIIVKIAEGFTNAQIAEMLHLSTHTINTHRKNIMAKLGVKNTAGIVMYAVKSDLVSPNKFLFASDS